MPNTEDSLTDSRRKHATMAAIAAFAVVGAAYVLSFVLIPSNGFWINDNGCKFIQLQGMIRTGYKDFSIPWPGRDLDPSFSCNPLPQPFGHVVDGKLYGTYSPVFALISSVPYRVFGSIGLYVIPLLAGLLTLPGVWMLAGRLSSAPSARQSAQPLAICIVGLATPIWFYSLTFWEHTPAACLTTWSVFFCVRHLESRSIGRLAAAAALSASAVYFRDELYLFGLAMTVVLIVFGKQKGRNILVFATAFVLTLLPLWLFQWLALGHPLGHHFRTGSLLDATLAQHLAERWSVARLLLLNVDPIVWLSLVLALPFIVLLVLNPRLRSRTFDTAVPACAVFVSLAGSVIITRHLVTETPIWWLTGTNGLFAASPVLLLAFLRLKSEPGDASVGPPDEFSVNSGRVIWCIVVTYIALYVLISPGAHSGGIHWGCRYLLPVFPLLGALAAKTVGEWWTSSNNTRKVGTITIALSMVFSVCLQVYSLTLLYHRKQFSAELNRVVAQRPEKTIVASGRLGWCLPQELAHCFYDKQFFLPRTQHAADQLLTTLRNTGAEQVLGISSPPTPDAGRGDGILLDDGSLNFLSVELRAVQLSE